MNYKKNFAIYLFVSLLCTAMVYYLSTSVCNSYYTKYPYTFDQVNGLIDNSQAYKDVKEHGRLAAAHHQYLQNRRSPLVPIVLSIVAPSLLRSHSGHLLIVIPIFFFFLVLWSYLMSLRNFSALLIVAVLFGFSTTWTIYSQYAGIAFNLPDTIASYPLAISGLSLLIWKENKRTIWLFCFAIFLSVAVLTRYVFSVYAFLLFAPILAWLFYDAIKTNVMTSRKIATSIGWVALVVAILCGYFVIRNYNYTTGYYNQWLDNDHQTMSFNRWFSFKTFMLTFPPFFGRIHLLTFLVLFLYQLFGWIKLSTKAKIVDGAISFWLLIGLPFLWIVILGSNGFKVRSAFLAAMPLTWVAVCSLSPLQASRRSINYAVCAIVVFLGTTHVWRSYNILNAFLRDADAKAVSTKKATVTIADILILHSNSVFSLVDLTGLYLAESIAVEYFYKSGSTVKLWPNNTIFSTHGDLWGSIPYKNQGSDELCKTVFLNIKRDCNLVLLKNPDSISLPSRDSRKIVEFVSENLRRDSAWHEFKAPLYNETVAVMMKKKTW